MQTTAGVLCPRRCRGVADVAGLVCSFLLLLWPAELGAQGHSVRGVVQVEGSGEPVVAAVVEVVELGASTSTDGEGAFVLSGLPAGAYTLKVSALGFGAWSGPLTLGSGSGGVVEVALALAPIQIPRITVLLGRTRLLGDPRRIDRIPGSAHYLGPEELEGYRLAYDDVHAVLRRVPGVLLQEEDGYGLRPNIGMRGTGSDRSSKIAVMEDGVLIAPAPYAAPAAYYFPVVGRMEAVEVRKGSSQIKYGPTTIGGALNLVSTSIPYDLKASAEAAGGEDATRKVRLKVGDSYRNMGWLFESYNLRTNGFKHLDGGGDTGFDVQDYVAKLRVNTDTLRPVYQELELKAGWTDHVSNETYLGLTEADFRVSPYRRYAASQRDLMEAEHRQVQLRYFLRRPGAFDVTATLYRNDFQRNWYKLQNVAGRGMAAVLESPDRYPAELAILRGADSRPGALVVRANNREYYARGVQTVMGLRLASEGAIHDLETGVRYHQDSEDRFQHEDAFQMSSGRMLLTRAGAPGSQSNGVSEANAWAFFLQDQITFGHWGITPGLRYESIEFSRTDYARDDPGRTRPAVRRNASQVLIPGLGVSYAPLAPVTLFAGVHKGFAPPGPGADEATRPEESINYELGMRLRRPGLHLEAIGFVSDYSNILGKATLSVGESGTGDLFNGGAVDIHGFELSAAYDLARGGGAGLELPLRLAYSYTRAEFRTSFQSEFEPWGMVRAGDLLPYLPAHQLQASLALEYLPWAVRLEGSYTSRARTVAGRGPIPPGQGTDADLVVNLSGDYRVVPWGTVYAAVQNLTDATYVAARRPAGARPGLPRTIVAGVRLNR
ncbi:MAG: TonB-dependent receptor [Gemmatimonadetes bacterium]|nr:TonB-dependent receptor [Gemmatimonadota bacterium]